MFRSRSVIAFSRLDVREEEEFIACLQTMAGRSLSGPAGTRDWTFPTAVLSDDHVVGLVSLGAQSPFLHEVKH